MHDILSKIFKYQLNNKTFAEWCAIKWEIKAPRFIKNITSQRENQFQETRKEKAKNYSENKMVTTCTGRSILHQLSSQIIKVPYGTVLSLHPFLITYATEKKIAIYLCKLYLNTRTLFEILIGQTMRDNNEITESLREFLMSLCE